MSKTGNAVTLSPAVRKQEVVSLTPAHEHIWPIIPFDRSRSISSVGRRSNDFCSNEAELILKREPLFWLINAACKPEGNDLERVTCSRDN